MRRSIRFLQISASRREIETLKDRFSMGSGPLTSDDASRFAQFLRTHHMYGTPVDRYRASRSVSDFIDSLQMSEDWMTIDSTVALIQCLAALRFTVGEFPRRCLSYLISRAEALSVASFTTTVLACNSVFEPSDVVTLVSCTQGLVAELAEESDLLLLSKCLRCASVLVNLSPEEAISLRPFVHAASLRSLVVVENIAKERSFIFSEQIATMFSDVGSHPQLFDPVTRTNLVHLLSSRLELKIEFLKTHHIVLVMRGAVECMDLFSRSDLVGLTSRLLDRFSSLKHVYSFSECTSLLSDLGKVLAFLRSDVATLEKKEDVVDLEIEIASFVNCALRSLEVGLMRNLVTNPDNSRIPSRQFHVQRHIPTRGELLAMLSAIEGLCVASPPEMFMWLHGSLVDVYYKSEVRASVYLGQSESGRQALWEEWRRTFERNVLRPCSSCYSFDEPAGVYTVPYPLSLNIDWVSFGTKYGRASMVCTTDTISHFRCIQGALLNSMSEKKYKYIPLAFAVDNLLQSDSNVKLLGLRKRELADIRAHIAGMSNGKSYETPNLEIDSSRKVETLLLLYTTAKIHLIEGFVPKRRSPDNHLGVSRSVVSILCQSLERVLSRSGRDAEREFRGASIETLSSIVLHLVHSNVLGDIRKSEAMSIALEVFISRLPMMAPHEFHYVLNVLFPKQLAARVKIVATDDMPLNRLLLAVRDESVSRLAASLETKQISFASDIPYARCVGVAFGDDRCARDTYAIGVLFLESALRAFKRQCTSSGLLLKASEELDALAVRLKEVSQVDARATLHSAVVASAASLAKAEMMSFADLCVLLRSFGHGYPKGFGEYNGPLVREDMLPVSDASVCDLHGKLIALSGQISPVESQYTPISIVFDVFASVHKTQWRSFLSAPFCLDGVLNSVRMSSLTQKSSFSECVARIICSHSVAKKRVPWALSEFLHHSASPPRTVVSLMRLTSDVAFNASSISRLIRRVPMLPIYHLAALLSFPLIARSHAGSVCYFFVSERILEVLLGKLSLRSQALPPPAGIKKHYQHAQRFSELAPPFSSSDDPQAWATLVTEVEAYKDAALKHSLGDLTFSVMAASLENSQVVDRLNVDSASEELRMCALAAKAHLELGYSRMSAEDLALRSYFFESDTTHTSPQSHESSFKRLCVRHSLSIGVLAIALCPPDAPQMFSRTEGDGTGLTDGFLRLCDAASREPVLYIESNPLRMLSVRSFYKKAVSSMKAAQKGKKSSRMRAMSLWSLHNKPYVRQEGAALIVKTSYFSPPRTLTTVFTESISSRFGSVGQCPYLFPHFRSAATNELRSFPKRMAAGAVSSFNVAALVRGCLVLGNFSLLNKCLTAFASCPQATKESINIQGLSEILSQTANTATDEGPMYTAVRDACLNHIVSSTDECFGRTLATASDVKTFLQQCGELISENTAVQRRILNRLEVVLPNADAESILGILDVFCAQGDCGYRDDLRLHLSRIPLYVCNDLSQFSGKLLVRVCAALNEARLLSQVTLDAIIAKVATDASDEDRWVPPSFEGSTSEGALAAFAKERANVSKRLQSITIKACEDVASTDDTIE